MLSGLLGFRLEASGSVSSNCFQNNYTLTLAYHPPDSAAEGASVSYELWVMER